MRESTIERYLCGQVRAILKGVAKKLTTRNDPDRMVLLPGRHIHFIELKAPGKKARSGQVREHERLWKLGFPVVILDTKEKVDRWIEQRREKE